MFFLRLLILVQYHHCWCHRQEQEDEQLNDEHMHLENDAKEDVQDLPGLQEFHPVPEGPELNNMVMDMDHCNINLEL